MIEVILATSNQHKAEEFSELFDKNVIQVKAAEKKLDVEETGTTFFENAFIKAKAYYELYKKPILADDSGLNVAFLPDELGIYSARFGGPGLNDRQRAELLLDKMKDADPAQREAYFTCVLCFYLNPNEVFYFEGRMKGSIGYRLQGEKGFGYDPTFHPEGAPLKDHSVAELPEWKALNSHRAVACQAALKFFKGRQ